MSYHYQAFLLDFISYKMEWRYSTKNPCFSFCCCCDLKASKERQIVAAMQCIVIDVGIENSLSSSLLQPPLPTDHLPRLKQTTKQKERRWRKLCMRFSMSLLPLLSLSLVSRHSIVFFFFTKSQSNKSASQRKEPENSHQRKSNFHFCAVTFKNGWMKWDKSDSQINVMCSRYFPQILPIHSSVLSNGKKLCRCSGQPNNSLFENHHHRPANT